MKVRGGQYDESLRAVFRALGIGPDELEDWNCRGATIYMSVDETTSLAISAQDLAPWRARMAGAISVACHAAPATPSC